MKLKVIIYKEKNETLTEIVKDFERWSEAERFAIRMNKELGGSGWDIKNCK